MRDNEMLLLQTVTTYLKVNHVQVFALCLFSSLNSSELLFLCLVCLLIHHDQPKSGIPFFFYRLLVNLHNILTFI